MEKYLYRVRYKPYFVGDKWYRTGLMSKESAEKVVEYLRVSHEKVEIYKDEDAE